MTVLVNTLTLAHKHWVLGNSFYMALSDQSISPQWHTAVVCASKRDSKIPKLYPRKPQESISSVKVTGNLITLVRWGNGLTHAKWICVYTMSFFKMNDFPGFVALLQNKKNTVVFLSRRWPSLCGLECMGVGWIWSHINVHCFFDFPCDSFQSVLTHTL